MKPNCPHITVLIADPNEVARIGLRTLLSDEPGFNVAGDTGHDALALALELRPDLIVLDPAVEGRLDVDLIRALRERCPASRLCIRTSVFEPRAFMEAMEAGVLGYLLKEDHDAALLRDALALIGRHGAEVCGPSVVEACRRQLAGHVTVVIPDTAMLSLSDREHTILKRLAEGHSRDQIAFYEHMSRRTVDRMISGLFRKFESSAAAELVATATRRGFLS